MKKLLIQKILILEEIIKIESKTYGLNEINQLMILSIKLKEINKKIINYENEKRNN